MDLNSQNMARESFLPKLIGVLCRGFFYYGLLASLIGLAVYFTAAGSYLIFLGGSAYYPLSGLWLGLISYFFLRRRQISVLLLFAYFLVSLFLVTWAWAIIEAGGLSGWLLLPRRPPDAILT